jgi:hypothetical protein
MGRQSYGDMYRAADFHRRAGAWDEQHGNCQIQDQDFFSCYDCVQQCDLGGLADLDTSKASVQVYTASLFILNCSHILPWFHHHSFLNADRR